MYDPRAIANFVLDVADMRCLAITNMALNKILYFAHGWSVGETGRPLVAATFEAWQHGPVIPIIYRQFSRNGRSPIRNRATRIDIQTGEDLPIVPALLPDDAAHVQRVTERLGPVSAIALSELSHEPGGPWDLVWNGERRVNPGMSIPHDLIEAYFSGKLAARSGTHVH